MIDIYLVDNVIIKTISYDEFGEPSASQKQTKGRIEYGTQRINDLEGEKVISNTNVYLKIQEVVGEKDKLYFDGEDHSILKIVKSKDFYNQYLRVYLK